MEDKAYDLIDNFEDWHWWHRARREIVRDVVLRTVENCRDKRLVDLGCGSGFFLDAVSSLVKEAVGVEAWDYKHRRFDNILKADIFDSGLQNASFDIVVSLDVLEHMEDERKFLDEVRRLMCDGARFVLTVPAYQFLFGYHDEINNHYRRYSKKRLVNLLRENGFRVKKASYFNFFLFPPFCAVRLAQKLFRINSAEQEKKSVFNGILYRVFRFERVLLRCFSLPFGSSLIAVCEKR